MNVHEYMPSEGLKLTLPYEGELKDRDVVEPGSTAGAVKALSAIGAPHWLGVVVNKNSDMEVATIRMRFQAQRGRKAGAIIPAASFFVMGIGNKPYPYTPAAAARHDGTAAGPIDVTGSSNDAMTITIDGTAQPLIVTAGAGKTFAEIAAEINAVAVGFKLEIDADGNINPVCTELNKTLEIVAVANSIYSDLGWIEGVYYPKGASHPWESVAGFTPDGAAGADEEMTCYEWV